jgi:hypothetical protein
MAEYCTKCGLVCYVGSRHYPDLNFKNEEGKYEHYDCEPSKLEDKKYRDQYPYGECPECGVALEIRDGHLCKKCDEFDRIYG